MWKTKAADKPALRTYISHKEIRKEHFFNNTLGNCLLFETRSGTLKMKRWWVKCGKDDANVMCACSGEEEEIVEHLVLLCKMLQLHQPS
uniref:Uncharacterized protein n=1 Tax=Ixodes ricinus TaxID=34613 RepID=V5IHL9_IXORI